MINLIHKNYGSISIDVSYVEGILIKKCRKCGNHYYVRYENEIMVRELMETHQKSLNLCDPCYIKEGRKRGFWE